MPLRSNERTDLGSERDVVWTPPGVKHWHGATRSSSMTHVSVSEYEEGSPVSWLEPVSDEQYRGPGGN